MTNISQSPFVTIGIPVFNDEEWIARTIESAVTQTYENLIILISDNFSSDNTHSICKEYADKFKKIKYYRQDENIGGYNNFNFLKKQCKTEFFMLLASDDWIDRDFIKLSVEFLLKNKDYSLVNANNYYYHNISKEFQFTTITTSVENESPLDRAISYIKNLTDNSEFYGLYRTNNNTFGNYPTIGCDWIWGIENALQGKIKSIKNTFISRNNKWINSSRSLEVAIANNIPQSQASEPHYATALYCFIHFSFIYKSNELSNNLKFGWKIFKAFTSHQNLPEFFYFYKDCKRLYGKTFADKFTLELINLLIDEFNNFTDHKPDALSHEEIFEIALTLNTWDSPFTNNYILNTTYDEYRSNIINTIMFPAYKLPRIRCISLVEVNLHYRYIKYLTATVQLFKNEEDIELFKNYTHKLINYFNDFFFPEPTIFPIRHPQYKNNALNLCINNLNMIPLYFSKSNIKDVMIERGKFFENYLMHLGININFSFTNVANEKRIKIGMIAQSFNSPTDTYTSLPIFSNIDKNKYDITFYALSFNDASSRTEIEDIAIKYSDRLITINNGSYSEIISFIRSENLDILLIGNNITAVSNPLSLISSARLAKNQVSFNPSCVTSGFSSIDYYISGSYVETIDSQSDYSEKLLLIDGPAHSRINFNNFQFYEKTVINDCISFVSGANFYKLTPQTLETWIKIMSSVSNSLLYLYPFGPAWSSDYDTDDLNNQIEFYSMKFEVNPSRVIILPPFSSVEEIHKFLASMDVYLDSFPFSGINSLLDPLLVGLPFISLKGNNFRSNMGFSVLRELDLNELMAEDTEKYIQIASNLALDKDLRSKFSNLIKFNLPNSKFYDEKWFSNQFQILFQRIISISN